MTSPHRRLGRLLALGAIVGLMVAVIATSASAGDTATLNPAHKGATNPGFTTGSCPTNTQGTGDWGWHFVLPGSDTDFVSISAEFQNAGTITDFVSTPTAKHAYVFTPGPDTLIDATAQVSGPQTEFNLSHVCTGTTNGGGGNGGAGGGGGAEVGGAAAERGPSPAGAAGAVTARPSLTG